MQVTRARLLISAAVINFLTAHELARLIAAKQVSPVEVLRTHLEQIDRLNPQLNAFICMRSEQALQEARAAEEQVMRGDALPPWLGVPTTIKSCIDVAGLRCEAGSKLRAGYVPCEDAPLVARLKHAGAIVIGNTNTPEMLMAYETDNAITGRTSNPWDLERSAGGSSGGEAAAIAAGCSALGIGSDGGGSIRVPANFCGIAGLKPTPGRIPGTGHFPACVGPFAQLGVVGPMARSIRDLEIALEVLTGYDAGDPMSAPITSDNCNLRMIKQTPIGLVLDGRATREIEAAVEATSEALRDSGFQVERFTPAGLEEAERLWFNIFCHAGAMAVRAFARDRVSQLSSMLRGFLDFMNSQRPLTTEELLFTLFERDQLRARFLAQMERYPVLLLPVSSIPAFRHGEGGWGPSAPANYLETMRYTQWFNLLGMPAVTIPVAQSREGLPIGMQIAGRPWEEERILAIAAVVEERFGFKAPPLAQATLTAAST